MVRGDVTLDYALTRLSDRRDKVGAFSRTLLERLSTTPRLKPGA
jgi:hypothetical protein